MIHPINKLRLLIKGRPYAGDLYQELYDFFCLPHIKTYQWVADSPEDDIEDWTEHFDYIGVDEKGTVLKVQNATRTPDNWVAGRYNPETQEIDTKQFCTREAAENWMGEPEDANKIEE